MTRITSQRASVLSFLSTRPGASAADVTRAVWGGRGHAATYAVVTGLRRAGLIRRGAARPESARGGAVGLYVVG
jgi:hypothetical protein